MHFDSMTPQDGSAHLAGRLAAIDEENFLASKNRAATKQWWIIHNHTSETRAPSWRGDSSGLCSRNDGKSTAIEKAFGAVLGPSSQALFLEVITEKTDQHCSTFWLPQWGQTTPPASYSVSVSAFVNVFLQALQ